jgi:hypothetical protein
VLRLLCPVASADPCDRLVQCVLGCGLDLIRSHSSNTLGDQGSTNPYIASELVLSRTHHFRLLARLGTNVRRVHSPTEDILIDPM